LKLDVETGYTHWGRPVPATRGKPVKLLGPGGTEGGPGPEYIP